MDKYNTLKNKKDFLNFISLKDEYLEEIQCLLNKRSIDFNEDEIKKISKYFIDLNKNNLFTNIEKRKFITYLGEAFRKKYGGIWDFTGLKSDSYAINEPVITKYKNEGLRICLSETIFKIFENDDEDYFNWSNKKMEDWQEKVDDVFNNLFPKRKKR